MPLVIGAAAKEEVARGAARVRGKRAASLHLTTTASGATIGANPGVC
jgi:hypothetical protein